MLRLASSVNVVGDCQDGVPKQHPGPGKSHYRFSLSSLRWLITVNRAIGARWLVLAKRALVEPYFCVVHEDGTVFAKSLRSMVVPAIDVDHPADRQAFTFEVFHGPALPPKSADMLP